MNVSETLNLAADKIERDGWWSPSGGNGVCASVAITYVSNEALHPAHRALLGYLTGNRDAYVGRIFDWNDAPGRTAAEVVEALRAAAVIEEAREEQAAAWETYAELVSA